MLDRFGLVLKCLFVPWICNPYLSKMSGLNCLLPHVVVKEYNYKWSRLVREDTCRPTHKAVVGGAMIGDTNVLRVNVHGSGNACVCQ